MREQLIRAIEAALARLLAESGGQPGAAGLPDFTVEAPRQAAHGDFACNAALLLAKRLGRPPRELAAGLIEHLGDAGGLVARAEVAGPGFVNLWLAGRNWHGLLQRILSEGSSYGRSQAGGGRPVQVEFVSANPTGPLSVGHGRQAILGDCLARLFEATGWKVQREYYFNDAGRQMRVLGESVRARYLEQLGRAAPPPQQALDNDSLPWPETLDGLPVHFPRDGYQGDYIGEIAAGLRAQHGGALTAEPGDGIFRREAQARIFGEIRATLERLGVHFDRFSNEQALYAEGCVEAVLDDLRAAGSVRQEDGATWLCSTALGLPRDRVLVKSGGESTYLLPDIAYHREKLRRGFELVVDVQGADHKDQGPYVKAGIAALGLDAARIEFLFHEFVTLSTGGKAVKQSTRRASFVTIDELLEGGPDSPGVSPDAFRFFMVQRRAGSHLDFDLGLARETDWTRNPAFYLQYAHARTHGIERQARERGIAMPAADELQAGHLSLPEELELIRKLGEFPEVVERAAAARAPHHVAYYLREVAGLWNPYVQDAARHRVLGDDAAQRSARLGLTLAVRTVLANGLGLLGMGAPERM
ncbi:MAG: arginine--tRNA ligase [Deltaproteobacteria bacterium]|nr:arginine--tRNA ligase [Deltaproteobacteria bacterium]